MMAEKYPELERDLRRLPHAQALGYETAVTWQATGSYRAHRVRMLEGFNPLVVGDRGWKELLGRGFQLHSELNYYGDLPCFYNMSRISFNATSRQMKNGVNQRVFDVPACGGVVVTDRTRQLEDLMEPGRDLLAYGNAEEIPDLVGRCLHDGRFHGKIAESGYRRVLDEHTYVKRAEKLVAAMRRDYT
jgi:spore maturation protein CgeB